MAELDPALQDEISNLQTRHTALVDAVRNYSGGSIAQATNDLLAAQAQTESTIDEREAALLGLIQRNTTQPVPSLLSDFATRTYMTGVRRLEHGVGVHDMWTVSRSSVRWVWGPNGKLVEVASDQPAYAYDPETGEPLGISIEPGSTNMLSHSDDISAWTLTNCSIVNTSEPSPINGVNYQKIVSDDGETSVSARAGYSPETSRTVVSGSIFVKASGAPCAFVRIGSTFSPFIRSTLFIDLSSGESQESFSSGITSPRTEVVALPDGSYRISASGGQDDDNSNLSIYVGPCDNLGSTDFTGDGVSGIYAIRGQVEENDTPTSPILTNGASATRAADVVKHGLGDEYNPNGFSVYTEARQKSETGSVVYLTSGELTNSIRVGLPSNGENALFVSTNGNLQAVIPLSEFTNYTPGDPAKLLLAVDPANGAVRLTINGQTMGRNVAEFPALDEKRIGGVSGNNNNINGTVHDYIKYPTVITASEAEAMTS